MARRAARHASAPTMLVGLAAVLCALSGLWSGCEARRTQQQQQHISQRQDATIQVTPSESSMASGGWRPVIDSRISYEVHPQTHAGSSSADSTDQTLDLVPPPPGELPKLVKKIKPTRKPNVKGAAFSEISGSETRVTPSGYTLPPPEGPTRPVVRFPDENRPQQTTVRRHRPSQVHGHHHHYHVRQNAYAGSESTQQLRFRPSPHVSAAYENPYPGWLMQNSDPTGLQQQQPAYYNSDSAAHLQLQQYNPEAQLQLALAQQQPELAQQQQYQQQQQVEIGQQYGQHQQGDVAQQYHQQNGAFQQGTQQIFGNAGLFNLNPAIQKDRRPEQDNLFLLPAATEPSVHENEVPQGPQSYNTHSTRGRPNRPNFDITASVQKFQVTEPTVPTLSSENSRPRRPRPPTNIQSQLESNRRPVNNGNEDNFRPNPTVSRPFEQPRPEEGKYNRPRHPRPPSTEPPSWSHPMQEPDSNLRVRRPRPPLSNQNQNQFIAEESATPETVRYRHPRPPTQEQDPGNQENVRVRRPRPPVQDQQWISTTVEPDQEHERPTQQEPSETQESVRPRRPRPPPQVHEEHEDDVERPAYTIKTRRPQPVAETEEEEEAPRIRQPKPTAQEDNFSSKRPEEENASEDEKAPTEEQQIAQEDVDETINVRPRRPRPPTVEERPRIRRPRPPVVDSVRRRRPRPPVADEEDMEPKRRRPQRPTEERDDEQDRRPNRLSKPLPPIIQVEDTTDEIGPETKLEEIIMPESVEFEITEMLPTIEPEPETTQAPTTTTTPAPLIPSIPPKRRRPIKTDHEDASETTENYPSVFRATTTTAPPTTTPPPSTTLSLIGSRLRSRLNSTRPRFSVGDYKDRLNRLPAFNHKKNNEDTTTSAPTGEDTSRVRQRTRDSSRFRLGSTTTTEEPNVERTTFKPVSRYTRPGNKYFSRYRASTEEPGTTTAHQDATRRTSTDIYALKGRRPYPLKTRISDDIDNNDNIDTENIDEENDTETPLTSIAFSVSEITTVSPTSDYITTTMQEDYKTEIATTMIPEPEPEPTTAAEDFSPAQRVTDLTSSATASKPLSFFSAVPADGKHASQLSSRFTMATEDPILPLEAFFPTFTSKSPRQHDQDD